MADILDYIDKMQQMYGDKEPSSMVQEPRSNYSNGLKVDPVADSGKKISQVLGAYKRYRRGEKNPKLNFNQFFELFSTENFATGGSAGQLVQPNADGSRPGYANPKGNPELGTKYTGEQFKGTIRPENQKRLNKVIELITESNGSYKKNLTAKEILQKAGFKDGYQSIGTTQAIRPAIMKEMEKLLTTQQKIDNYVNNVMLSEDALVKDFKNPQQHIAKKFGVSRGTMRNWAKNSEVYKDNKALFNGLSKELSFNKYKFEGEGVPRLMSDYSIITQNKLPSSQMAYGADSPTKFIMDSAFRSYMQNKAAGKTPKIFFVGNPELMSPSEWKFIKGGKLYSTDASITELEFNGKTYKNNYLNRVDAKTLYANDFGNVYKRFDDLNTYMNTFVPDPNNPKKQILLDTLLRRKAFDETGKKSFLERRFVELDHGDLLNDPFGNNNPNNLRLLDRQTNVKAGLFKRLDKYKNNPKLLNKTLTDIGYFNMDKDTDAFIKRMTKRIIPTSSMETATDLSSTGKMDLNAAKEKFLTNLDNNKFRRVSTVLINAAKEGGLGEAVQKICMRKQAKKGGRMFLSNGSGCPAADQDPKGFLKSVSDNPQLAKFLKSSPGKKAAALAARVTGNVLNPTTLIGGEVAFVLGEGLNNFASGLDLAESFDRAFIFGDFGKFEKNLMDQARELNYDDNQLNLLQQTININKLNNKQKKLNFGLDVEEQDPSGLTSDATMGFEDRLVNTKNELDNSVQNYIGTLDKMGFDLTKDSTYDVGFRYLDNVFKKRTQNQLKKTFDQRKDQIDPTQTPFGNFISPAFDLGSYTQPLKYAFDVVNPFTKDVPFLSERQQEAKKLREMSKEELDAYNKERGFTLENIEQGTAPQIRPLMNYLGTDVTGQGFGTQFLAGGGIASLTKTIPPESGPTPQGLPYVYNNVKKI